MLGRACAGWPAGASADSELGGWREGAGGQAGEGRGEDAHTRQYQIRAHETGRVLICCADNGDDDDEAGMPAVQEAGCGGCGGHRASSSGDRRPGTECEELRTGGAG